MWPGHERWVITVLVTLAGAASVAAREPEVPEPSKVKLSRSAALAPADAAVESYLQQRGLKSLLAEQLSQRLADGAGDERGRVVEKLGRLYIDLIAASRTTEERLAWEERAKDLVKRAPESQTYELRLDLAKAIYAQAEEVAERYRLRLLDDSARLQAEKDLRGLKLQFEAIAADLGKRVESLDRAGNPGRDEELADARRVRSTASYYAGWSGYYLALVTGDAAPAAESLRWFGTLLGRTGNLPASADKLPKGLLKYEHIARAAIGCALCNSLIGSDAEALRWLDVIEADGEASASIKSQLLSRRIVVLGAAKRWDELARLVKQYRKPPSDSARANPPGGVVPQPERRLEVSDARLLSVLALDAGKGTENATLRELGRVGLEDLIAKGQIAHVLDMASRFGVALLGDEGFIAQYVRGVRTYDDATAAQKAKGENLEEPSADPAIINAYRDAARVLALADTQSDTAAYPIDAVKCQELRARALFHAGDLAESSEIFAKASSMALAWKQMAQAQESLWFAIVALDKGLRVDEKAGRLAPSAQDRLDELTALFLREFPGTPRAAQLLISQTGRSTVKDEEAVKTLLAVARDQPIYEASRRQAARILYRLYRAAGTSDRPFHAARFGNVAEELLAIDRRLASQSDEAAAKEATARVITTARQLLDTVLSVPGPDVQRAQSVLSVLESVATFNATDLSAYRDELTFRRFQIAMAMNEPAAAEAIAEELSKAPSAAPAQSGAPQRSSRFALSAQRILYLRALDALRAAESTSISDPARAAVAARSVVTSGQRVIRQYPGEDQALSDPAVVSVYGEVSRAAVIVFDVDRDEAMRALALKLDRAVLAAAPGQIEPLRRLAKLSEAGGDTNTAMECWRTLSLGLPENTPDWFAARFNFVRLLAEIDAVTARRILDQHLILYARYGPEPWGMRLKALHDKLGGPSPAPGAAPANQEPPS